MKIVCLLLFNEIKKKVVEKKTFLSSSTCALQKWWHGRSSVTKTFLDNLQILKNFVKEIMLEDESSVKIYQIGGGWGVKLDSEY